MRRELGFKGKRLIVDAVHTQGEFSDFMSSLRLKPPFIVKPNWICTDYGHFTDPRILEWMLRFLRAQGEVTVVESYSARNTTILRDLKLGMRLSDYERTRMRESEYGFLERTGIKSLLEELRIEYVNVTEEVLERRTVDKEVVRGLVESRYPPVLRNELYGFLPTKLHALRTGTFISLAKFKMFFTLCTKNMFGLIPEYVAYGSRSRAYHGRANGDLNQNIADINKIYRSIFNVVGIVEGINSLSYNIGRETGSHRAVFGYRYDTLENRGLIYYGDDPLWLDAFIHQQCGKDPLDEEQLKLASQVFGRWPSELTEEAEKIENPLKQ